MLMVERLSTRGTLRLLVAIRRQASKDIKDYGKKCNKRGDYVSESCYENAVHYIDVELPVIREVISESFKG